MPAHALEGVLQVLRAATPPTDRDLLANYAAGDQAAFAVLVRRHGPLVLSVCRRLLANHQDAEDACQATFLFLAQKATSVTWQPSVANWLHATARRVALKARRAALRRDRFHVRAVPAAPASPLDELTGRETFAVLDEELERLPSRYREPLLLCYLQGLTRDQAAARLGVAPLTVKSQLDRGRKRPAEALTRRGIAPGVGLLALAATSSAGAAPSRLVEAILAAVEGSPSPAAAALAHGVVVKSGLRLLALAAALFLGVIALAHCPRAAESPESAPEPAPAQPKRTAVFRVVDADGRPVSGATVRRTVFGLGESVVETLIGRTDAAGRLEAAVDPPGIYTATAPGHAVAWALHDYDGRPLELCLARPLPIRGRLVDLQGRPIPGVRVRVLQVDAMTDGDLIRKYNALRTNREWTSPGLHLTIGGSFTGSPTGATTDKDGRFTLIGAGLGFVLSLRFETSGIEAAPAHVFVDPQFSQRVRLPSEAERRSLGKDPEPMPPVYGPEFTHAAHPDRPIRGAVTDARTGRPLAGVTVVGMAGRVGRADRGDDPVRYQVKAVTDAAGRYRLDGMPRTGSRSLHFQARPLSYLDCLVELKDADTRDTALEPALVVEGQLVNRATGKPTAGAVSWLPLRSNGPLRRQDLPQAHLYGGRLNVQPSGTSASASADGRFRLVVPSSLGLVLVQPGLQGDPVWVPVRVREADRKYLRPLEPARPGAVGDGPVDRSYEEHFDTLDMAWPVRWLVGYTILDPAPGAAKATVRLELDPGATVRVEARDPEGRPLTGVTFAWPAARGQRRASAATFTIGGLEPKGRPQQVFLLHRERRLCAERLLLGDEQGPVVVQLRPCCRVTGRAVTPDDKPLTGAFVSFQLVDPAVNDLIQYLLSSNFIVSDADGRFVLDGLFQGWDIYLYVRPPGVDNGPSAMRRVHLGTSETRDIGDFRALMPKNGDTE